MIAAAARCKASPGSADHRRYRVAIAGGVDLGSVSGVNCGEPVLLLNEGGYVVAETRLKVCTRAGVDESTSDVIIFPEATDAITAWYVGIGGTEAEQAAAALDRVMARCEGREASLPPVHPPRMKISNQHVYGFISPDVHLGARERLRLEWMLGPVIHRVAGFDGPLAGVEVLVAEVPPIPVPAHVGGLARKRQSIWQLDQRNTVIAEVAAALASGCAEALWKHGLLLDGASIAAFRAGIEPSSRVAILVESPPHGRELARRLSGWPLRHGRWAGGRSVDHRHDDLPDRSIITLVYAHGLDRLDVDVLIRADGSNGPLSVPGFPPRERDHPGRRVLLVDFGDDGDEVATEATRRRLDDYQARGWAVTAPDRWFRTLEPTPAETHRSKSNPSRARKEGR